MRKYIEQLDPEIRDLIYQARDIAARQSVSAYVVGGFVRDLLLGVENLDLDIVVEGDGIRFAREFAAPHEGRLLVHKRFGTATVAFKTHHKVDIASARKEFYPQPGSLPVVNPGSIRDDLFRRDFTINTLALDINSGERFGRLLDLFHGRQDLASGAVRILHDMSFIDDPTRLLRAIRFEQRYRFALESRTLACLREAVRLNMLAAVAAPRLRDELVLLLKEKQPLPAACRVQELLGWDFLCKGLRFSLSSQRSFTRIPGTIDWFRQTMGGHRHVDVWLVYLMALVDHLDHDQLKRLCAVFEFGRSEARRLLSYGVSQKTVIERLKTPRIRASTVFHLLEPLSYEVILAIKAGSTERRVQQRIEDFFHRHHGTSISVGGHDLKEMGIEPGPHYQKIFRKVLSAKVDGKLGSRAQELAFVASLKRKKS